MRRILIIILTLLLVVPVFGQRRKKGDEEAGPGYVEGITYALPRAGVRIKVKAVKETFEPGPYASYAQQLLGINDAKNRASVRWQLKDIVLESFSEPDPGRVYKAMGEGAFTVSLTPQGCLAGINAEVDPPSSKPVQTNRFISAPEKEDGFSFASFNDTPLYSPGDSATNFRPVRINEEKKAAEAAARIMECRLTRFHMVAGLMDEFHPDGSAYKVSLEELNRIEKEYLSLFVGRNTYSNEIFSFEIIPEPPSSGKGEVVFRFSEEQGVLPASDLSGKPVMMKVEPLDNLTEKYKRLSGSENPFAGKTGVYYCMPGIGEVGIIFELKTIASARMVLPQFGETAPLPEDLLFGDYKIEFHPETGAIKSISESGR